MRAESQVGYSGPQLTSKVHLPTPGETNKFDVNRRPSVKPRATRLAQFALVPKAAKTPGARALPAAPPGARGAGARQPPAPRPPALPALTPPSLRGAVQLQAPGPAAGAAQSRAPRRLSPSRALAALECTGVGQPSASASKCFGVRGVQLAASAP